MRFRKFARKARPRAVSGQRELGPSDCVRCSTSVCSDRLICACFDACNPPCRRFWQSVRWFGLPARLPATHPPVRYQVSGRARSVHDGRLCKGEADAAQLLLLPASWAFRPQMARGYGRLSGEGKTRKLAQRGCKSYREAFTDAVLCFLCALQVSSTLAGSRRAGGCFDDVPSEGPLAADTGSNTGTE